MSFAMLEFQVNGAPKTRTLFLAVDNPNSLPVERLQNIPHVNVAFERDKTGSAVARAFIELLPQVKRLKPKAQVWNQQLLDYGQQFQQQHHQPDDDLTQIKLFL
ncbi:hypothetical protein [Nostoc sp. TCL26-01]|uniref:hypothetical protein n=1 Tax=Nostoc sp. TCL26-01 TaxID=2576904 RepID=UPI0015BB25D9|nr:hypothetical protein [Nostoc sp. TCL26-01]